MGSGTGKIFYRGDSLPVIGYTPGTGNETSGTMPGEQRVDFILENVYRWMWVPFIPMILDQDNMNRIKKLLKSRPKGLTISDIAQILKLNRNSAAKYLEILSSPARWR